MIVEDQNDNAAFDRLHPQPPRAALRGRSCTSSNSRRAAPAPAAPCCRIARLPLEVRNLVNQALRGGVDPAEMARIHAKTDLM